MTALDDAAARAKAAYDAAADTYDAPANGFWQEHGRRTVDRLSLSSGANVLDAPCGSGASALVAARTARSVVAVDVAPRLLELVRAKARAAGLTNVEAVEADIRATGFADATFDAVVCVHGVFFVPDRSALVRELWRLVAPGGTLAITTWGPRVLEPGATAFWSAVRRERPDLVGLFNPWDDLVEPERVVQLFEDAGIDGAAAELVEYEQPLDAPEAWWDVVMGSGFRGTVDKLEPATRDRVRSANLAALEGVTAIHAAAIYAAATKQP